MELKTSVCSRITVLMYATVDIQYAVLSMDIICLFLHLASSSAIAEEVCEQQRNDVNWYHILVHRIYFGESLGNWIVNSTCKCTNNARDSRECRN